MFPTKNFLPTTSKSTAAAVVEAFRLFESKNPSLGFYCIRTRSYRMNVLVELLEHLFCLGFKDTTNNHSYGLGVHISDDNSKEHNTKLT